VYVPLIKAAVGGGALYYFAVGDGSIFNCAYAREAGDASASRWFLDFYGGAIFAVYTGSAAIGRDESSSVNLPTPPLRR
jgi:hypothetical protein